MANQSKILSDLLDRMEPEVAKAWRKAMADWRSAVDMAAIVRAISNNDILGAISAMNLDPAALQVFLGALQNAYQRAGAATVAAYPKVTIPQSSAKMVIRFNGRDPVAEQFLRTKSAELVSNITTNQQEAIRKLLAAGLAAGDNPTAVALDLVGRIGQNGKRQGGVIGLTVPQADYLIAAKAELKSMDSGLLRNYLTRQLRDHRFDGFVLRAIESGTKIPVDARTRMLVSYSNRLLKQRGDTIARTETLSTLHASQDEAVRQTLSASGIKTSAVTKTWRSAHDRKVRHTHTKLNGQKVGYLKPFVSPSGAKLMYPGDRSLGAPAGEIINCRCIAPVKIDFLAGVK